MRTGTARASVATGPAAIRALLARPLRARLPRCARGQAPTEYRVATYASLEVERPGFSRRRSRARLLIAGDVWGRSGSPKPCGVARKRQVCPYVTTHQIGNAAPEAVVLATGGDYGGLDEEQPDSTRGGENVADSTPAAEPRPTPAMSARLGVEWGEVAVVRFAPRGARCGRSPPRAPTNERRGWPARRGEGPSPSDGGDGRLANPKRWWRRPPHWGLSGGEAPVGRFGPRVPTDKRRFGPREAMKGRT